MILTEAEAKTKWCPFACAADQESDAVSANRHWKSSTPDLSCMCLASGCMAWRWTGTKAEPVGYCGLAGEP